ncbi:MAG: hypothetical protein LBD53_08830 [Tannerella sp.]|jgi:predicted AAA+ superfamily ATPase|nr:hypothetical protein [Tannerella sp.]
MQYIKRITENELQRKLNASGAVLIKGPKSCGKTEMAKQFAKSILQVDKDERVEAVMSIEGQFILTGSANPEEQAKLHSGAGRFTVVKMHTMSWQEMGFSTGEISMEKLLSGEVQSTFDNEIDVELIVERMLKGGWPALLDVSIEDAMEINQGYIDLLAEADMSRVSNVKRDPVKIKILLKAIARNIATLVENTTLEKDIKSKETDTLSRPTLIDYLDALERLMIFEEQPAFGMHIRSANSLRKAPKRHLCDISLAIAALGLDKQALLDDLKYCGFFRAN